MQYAVQYRCDAAARARAPLGATCMRECASACTQAALYLDGKSANSCTNSQPSALNEREGEMNEMDRGEGSAPCCECDGNESFGIVNFRLRTLHSSSREGNHSLPISFIFFFFFSQRNASPSGLCNCIPSFDSGSLTVTSMSGYIE